MKQSSGVRKKLETPHPVLSPKGWYPHFISANISCLEFCAMAVGDRLTPKWLICGYCPFCHSSFATVPILLCPTCRLEPSPSSFPVNMFSHIHIFIGKDEGAPSPSCFPVNMFSPGKEPKHQAEGYTMGLYMLQNPACRLHTLSYILCHEGRERSLRTQNRWDTD